MKSIWGLLLGLFAFWILVSILRAVEDESLAERQGHGDCVLKYQTECTWLPYPHRVWVPVR